MIIFKEKKRNIISAVCIIVFFVLALLLSQKIIYGKWFITNWSRENQSNIIKDYSDLMSYDIHLENKMISIGENNDAQLYFKVPKNTRFLQINITEISTYKEKLLKIFLPSNKGFTEEKFVYKRMKEGNNVFCFDESISGLVRLDFEGKGPYSFRLNFIQYNSGTQSVAEFWGMFILTLCICSLCFAAYLKRERILNLLYRYKTELFVLSMFFFLYLVWSLVIPFNKSPDEKMRYDVAQYIFQYKKLPRGDDPVLCMKNGWGISYAFSPYLAYLISAVFMHFASIFGVTGVGLMYVSRLVSVFSSVITLIFLMKLSSAMKFKNKYILPCLVGLLPEFTFISSYINNDAFAVMSVSIIVYAWYTGIMSEWDKKSCIYLSVGMSLCMASYYNCYGYLLISFLLFVLFYIYKFIKSRNVKLIGSMVKKGLFMAFFTSVVSGWWFIRNYIIYNGDILGNSYSRNSAIKYALPELNPLNKTSLYEQGFSLKQMLFNKHWIDTSIKSFIACFDYMGIWLKDNIYMIVLLFIFIGLVLKIISMFRKEYHAGKLAFDTSLFAAAVIVVILSVIYSYMSDFQPQGRYLLPAAIPLMIYISEGYLTFAGKYKAVQGAIILSAIVLNLYCCVCVIIPYYMWN